jgi:hypothetical protein
VIVGWIVINAQHNRRETRKEIRAALNDLYDMLNDIEDDAFVYHTGAGDPVLSRRIKRKLGQIFARVNLALVKTIDLRCASEIGAFRRAVTLHNFDTARHQSLLPVDQIFEEITATKERLVNRIERAFLEKYR